MTTRTQTRQATRTQAQRPMPNIMDFDSAADWQVAWNAWNEAQAAERAARIHAARSNAAKRGAATHARRGDTTYINVYGHKLHACQECGWRGNVTQDSDRIWRCHECSRVAAA